MLELQLGITTDSNNVLNKTMTNLTTVTGEFNSSVNLINPVVRLGYVSNIEDFNYCYIPSLQRYYFIDRAVIERTDYWLLYLTCDVLMTYKQEILALSGIVTNSANSNPYYKGYIDSYDVRQSKEILEFENNFNENGSIILIGVKGGVN